MEEEITDDELIGGAARGDHRGQSTAGAVRLGAEEQGRSAVLDAVVDYLPSPLDVPPVNGHQPRYRRRS